MIENDIYSILLGISTLLTFLLIIFIARMKNRQQIHYAFFSLISSLFIWNLSILTQKYIQDNGLQKNISDVIQTMLEQLYFVGVTFVSISLLFTGIIFALTRIRFTKRYLLLFIIPIISLLMIFTNNYHHLFIVKYSLMSSEIIYGAYFIVHTIYSYLCILVGLYFLVYFSIKNSGFFTKQSMLIFWGTLIPFLVDTLSTFKIVDAPVYIENIAISVAIVCYFFAIIKFNFLNVIPVALQKVVDHISDSFIVLNNHLEIIDYNKSFIDTFDNIFDIKRKADFKMTLNHSRNLKIDSEEFIKHINDAIKIRSSVIFEKHIFSDTFDKHFSIEITPLLLESKPKFTSKILAKKDNAVILGIIILFKDITQSVRDLIIIKEKQAILIEQERLASLGQLIGGIAHNLKTPIMSISGGIEALKDLTYEYRDSIDDKSVTEQDHKEIAREMLSWLDRIKPYCSYMSDVISAVKGQAVQMNASTTLKFTVDELVKRVNLLLKHELKKYLCILNMDIQIDLGTEIKGEVNNLVQVFDNIIINSMQAYEGKNGTIDLTVIRSGDNVEFTFKDYGKGIPKLVADKLFKEMITTKGKNGTGLGMYMSYSTIKGRFGGNMSFTSKEDIGTTFFVSIPCITYSNREAG
jgi:two-component system, NtrC family, sensor histidine kinase HupT/HoxJ